MEASSIHEEKILNLYSNEDVKKITDLQKTYQINRAYKLFQDIFHIHIKESSKRNFNHLRFNLKRGADHLEAHISSNSKVQKILKKERTVLGNHYLTYDEAPLFDFLIQNFSLKHQTAHLDLIEKNGNELVSLQQRERINEDTENRHTAGRYGVDDNNFFVLGIGNHMTPSFLGIKGHIIEAGPLHRMAIHEPDSLKSLWVSGHLSEYVNNTCSHKVILGETIFSFQHDWESKTKTYLYQRENGTILKRVVHLGDEIFAGSHVQPGTAFQLIEHLRFIGEPYRSHVLKCVSSNGSFEEKMIIISRAMKHLMPGWIYPEAKIPVKFSLNSKFVNVKSVKESLPVEKKKKQIHKKLDDKHYALLSISIKAVRSGDLSTLIAIVKHGYCFGKIDSDLIIDAITFIDDPKISLKIVQFLVEQGVTPFGMNSSKILLAAVKKGNLKILDWLLKLRKEDKEDPFIKHPIDINSQSRFEVQFETPTPLEFACLHRKHKVLKFLIDKGGDVKRHKQRLLNAAAESGDIEIFKILLENGADFKEKAIDKKSPLMRLAEKGQVEAIQFAIHHGADVNERFWTYNASSSSLMGYSPLHFAVENGKTDAAKILISLEADINSRSQSGMTPYAIAKRKLNHDMIKILKKNGANLNLSTTPYERCTEYQFATAAIVSGFNAEGERIVVLGRKSQKNERGQRNYLLPGGYKDLEDDSSLKAAIREVHEEIGLDLSKMVDSGKIQVGSCYTYEDVGINEVHYKTEVFHFDLGRELATLRIAAHDDLKFVEKIKVSDIIQDLSAKNNRSFFVKGKGYIKQSNGLLLKNLFENKLDESVLKEIDNLMKYEHDGYHLLIDALNEGNVEDVYKLLDYEISIKPKEKYPINTPLQIACKHGYLEVVKLLLEKGADVDSGLPRPIFSAWKKGNFDIVFYLLENTQISSNTLQKLLSKAAGKGQKAIVDKLLKKGLNINTCHPCKNPPLTEAVAAGKMEMAAFLISRGADVNVAQDIGEEYDRLLIYSPLMKAIETGNESLLQFLIDHGADINKTISPEERYDAITFAICKKQKSIAQKLIALGKVQWNDHLKVAGKTLELALKYGWEDIAAQIAFQQINQAISYQLSSPIFKITLEVENQGCPTIVIHLKNKEKAEQLGKMLKATVHQTRKKFNIRLRKVRLGKLFSNKKQGKLLYNVFLRTCLKSFDHV